MSLNAVGGGLFSPQANNTGESAFVTVLLSSDKAQPKEEATAVMKSIGYTDADLQTPAGSKIKDELTANLSRIRHNYHAGQKVYDAGNKRYVWKAMIPLNAAYHRELKAALAEIRAGSNGHSASATATRAGQKLNAYGASSRVSLRRSCRPCKRPL